MTIHEQKFALIILFAAMTLEFCSGCGGRDPRIPPLAQAVGIVTYKGEPLAGATVMFASVVQDQGYHPGIGRTNNQGEFRIRTYNLDGAVVGRHKVSIVALDPDAGIAPGTTNNSTRKPYASLIPQEYGNPEKSTLTAEVTSGIKNEFDFEVDDK